MAFDKVVDSTVLDATFTAIADAIRDKKGITDLITPEQMPEEIYGIVTDGENGAYDEEWFHDGDTHIWVRLIEGRTSPILGVCPNGTVTVDWGDGTEPDTLTGTSTSAVKWTPTHNYAEPGDYIITLKTDGQIGFAGSSSNNQYSYLLRHSSGADVRNDVYRYAIHKVECGANVSRINNYAFYQCISIISVTISDGVASIGEYAFSKCYSLTSVTIPDGVASIGNSAFSNCYSLTSVTIPDGVASIGNSAFQECYSLTSVAIPGSVSSIGSSAFYQCYSLISVTIPDGVARIDNSALGFCSSLTSVTIPGSVSSIAASGFYGCGCLCYCDFTKHTTVPTLEKTNAFDKTPTDLQILVPAGLYDEWIAATNWSAYASQIVAV